jgi:hypothetical protein
MCGLFISEFEYLRLQINYFSGTYPPIYSHSWPFYLQIRYIRAKFLVLSIASGTIITTLKL